MTTPLQSAVTRMWRAWEDFTVFTEEEQAAVEALLREGHTDDLRWGVSFTDGREAEVTIPDVAYQSDDHVHEAVAKASGRPDDVDDVWPL